MFWLNTALLGGALGASTPEQFRGLIGWGVAVFLSVLIHELGHALAMRSFGDHRVGIVLYGFGGYAQGSVPHTRSQDLQLTAAGPGLQIAAGLAVGWAMTLWRIPFPWLREVCLDFVGVSIFWALLNLLPILPLDGGRICSALVRNTHQALKISVVCAAVIALSNLSDSIWIRISLFFHKLLQALDIHLPPAIFGGSLIMALFFGLLAYNNWKQLQGEREIPWMNAQ